MDFNVYLQIYSYKQQCLCIVILRFDLTYVKEWTYIEYENWGRKSCVKWGIKRPVMTAVITAVKGTGRWTVKAFVNESVFNSP